MSNKIFYLSAILVTLFLCACQDKIPVQGPFPGKGGNYVLDTGGGKKPDTGWYPSIEVAKDGSIHLAYCDVYLGDLRYAYRAPGKKGNVWQKSIVDGDGAVGKYISLQLDSKGRPHIVYYDQDFKHFRHITKLGHQWESDLIDVGLEIGMGNSFIIAADGTMHLIYYNHRSNLMYAHRRVDAKKKVWKKQLVDKVQGSYSSQTGLAVIPSGKIIASYLDWKLVDSELKYALLSNGKWKISPLWKKDNPGWKSAITVDKNQNISLAFLSLKKHHIYLKTFKGGIWSGNVLLEDATSFKMASLNRGEEQVIAYQYNPGRLYGSGMLYYGKTNQGKWSVYIADDSPRVGAHLDVAFTPEGQVIIAYYDTQKKNLKIYEEE